MKTNQAAFDIGQMADRMAQGCFTHVSSRSQSHTKPGRTSRAQSNEPSPFATISELTSLPSWNKPRHASLHDCIKSLPRFDSLTDLSHGVFRQRGDIKVLLNAARGFRRGKERRAALDRPRERHLGRSFVNSFGDGSNHRII
jgi:hypothetical protein